MFKVNVAPDMGMYTLLRSQGYDPGYALAEFVDNAIHAYLTQSNKRRKAGDPLRVDLRFYSPEYADSDLRNCVVISDDGPGINRETLPKALKPAHPPTQLGLSEFGIGMKAAAVWFTDTWTLTTRPADDTHEFVVPFNLEALLKSGQDTVDVASHLRAKKTAPGTDISLKTLRRPLEHARYEEVCMLLQALYQRFTAGAMPQMVLTAWFDGTPRSLKFTGKAPPPLEMPVYRTVDKQVYAIGKTRVWSDTVYFEFMGRKVTGFLQVSETGSYKENPGLVLFRNDRVIKGTALKPYSPDGLVGTGNKYGRQRIYGELNLDGLPVTYTKDDFDFNEGAFIARMREVPGIDALLRQAESYRSKDQDVVAVADEAALEAKLKAAGKTVRTPKAKPANDSSVATGSTAAGTKDVPADPGKSGSALAGTTKPTKKAQPESTFVEVLFRLRETAGPAILKSLIDEASQQYTMRRPLAAAMCFRAVLEAGFMHRLQIDFPNAYKTVAHLGIKETLNKFHTRSGDLFVAGRDQRVIKCVQSVASGKQLDVVLLNNISHGSYIPTRAELDDLVRNLEALLDWSYLAGSYSSSGSNAS